MQAKTDLVFARVEGSMGTITIEGAGTSMPSKFTFTQRESSAEKKEYEFPHPGYGKFFYEADAVAHDIAAGKTENAIMPWAETLRVLGLMDAVRARGGARFPQDDVHG